MRLTTTFTLPLLVRCNHAFFLSPHATSSIIRPTRGVRRSRLIHGVYSRHFSRHLSALPTIDEVSSDDFMKQLDHASQIIPLLHPAPPIDASADDDDAAASIKNHDLLEILSRQLSHSDGIRGFFAVYLTSPQPLLSDEVPWALAEAVCGADPSVMVPLACMNVVMPTAMSSIHTDSDLIENASNTAENGKKILRLLKGEKIVINNCKAIYCVCTDEKTDLVDAKLIQYWKKFFTNYKYGAKEKEKIGAAISEFC